MGVEPRPIELCYDGLSRVVRITICGVCLWSKTGLWLSEKFEGTGYKEESGLRAMVHWLQATTKKQAGIIQSVFFPYEPLKLKFKHLPLEKNCALNQVSHIVAITHSQLLLRKRQDLALYEVDTEYHTSNIYTYSPPIAGCALKYTLHKWAQG